jgi:hypothetical protein
MSTGSGRQGRGEAKPPSALVWLARLAWIAVAPVAAPALSDALGTHSEPVVIVASAGLWALWVAGIVVSFVPSTVSLTTWRLIAPGAIVVTILAWLGAAGGVTAAIACAVAIIAASLVFSGDVGRVFAQASAYGDEARFPLRPPAALVLGPLPIAWALAAAGLAAGPLLLAARSWIAGAITLVVGLPVAWLLARRMHRLAQRWAVFVPAGFVVRDAFVLADTVMLRQRDIDSIGVASGVDPGRLDLSGPAFGRKVAVRLLAQTPILLAGTLQHREGRPTKTAEFEIAPTRPGALLEEVARRQQASAPPRT